MKVPESLARNLVASVVGFAALALAANLPAQTHPGKAEVRAIKGSASASTAGGVSVPLKVGAILTSGATVKTAPSSTVDLFLGNSAGVVRVTENTTLELSKLTITDTGADTVVDVQLNLSDGTILGNVNKLSAASKYEIKVPNGVAGIRGTKYRISSTSYCVLLDGTLVFVYVPPGGNPIPYTLASPPAVYFSPVEGVKPAPEDLVREVNEQFGGFPGRGRGGPPITPPPFVEPFVSPGVGRVPGATPPGNNNNN